MEINDYVILVTPKQLEWYGIELIKYSIYDSSRIWDKRREYFARAGYKTYWFKGIPVVSKRLKKYNYIDFRKIGNGLAKWIKELNNKICAN